MIPGQELLRLHIILPDLITGLLLTMPWAHYINVTIFRLVIHAKLTLLADFTYSLSYHYLCKAVFNPKSRLNYQMPWTLQRIKAPTSGRPTFMAQREKGLAMHGCLLSKTTTRTAMENIWWCVHLKVESFLQSSSAWEEENILHDCNLQVAFASGWLALSSCWKPRAGRLSGNQSNKQEEAASAMKHYVYSNVWKNTS